jgi:hypothetical protein
VIACTSACSTSSNSHFGAFGGRIPHSCGKIGYVYWAS